MITNETRIDKQVCSYCNQGFLDCYCLEFHPNLNLPKISEEQANVLLIEDRIRTLKALDIRKCYCNPKLNEVCDICQNVIGDEKDNPSFNKETAKQLITFLSNQYISHNDYPLVHKLIHDLQEYLK